jgi:hypothetical protein
VRSLGERQRLLGWDDVPIGLFGVFGLPAGVRHL